MVALRQSLLALASVLIGSICEARSATASQPNLQSWVLSADEQKRLDCARWWLTTEFNVSTLTLEDQMSEMLFFIRKAAPYRGMEVRVVSEDITTHRYERDVMAEAFKNITGINIVHDIRDEGQVVNLLSEQVQLGTGPYDAYVSDSDLIGTHWRSCQITSISDWVLNDGVNVTLPSLDIHDFIGLDFVTAPDGKVYQLPDQQFANLYWFRYDWFTDPVIKERFRQSFGYELGVPLDWTAYEDIADFFTNTVREVNGTRIYGHMDYGKNDASLGWRFHDAWLSMAGASDQGEPNGLPVDEWGIRVEQCRPVGASVERGGAVNSAASIYAATKYIEWQLEYAPPGTLDLNFSTAGSWPSKGNIAQQIFWYTTFTTDLCQSPNVMHPDGRPKWRMAPSPHGPYWRHGMKIGYQDVGSWTLLESTPPDRKAAAWLYAQFTVCKSLSLKKALVGLTPIRESDIWSQAMTERAPYLGGLVEFYRSPDRARWSPTGTNVPDYPRLAPLWWKNIGEATMQAAAGGDARTVATKAMDKLAHDMDAMLYHVGLESDHPCAPQLGPRRSQTYWLQQPGAPQDRLLDEMPPGHTIDYDTLVQAWREGMSINYELGPDMSRQGCHPNGPVGAPYPWNPKDGRQRQCDFGFRFNNATGACEPRVSVVTYTITNLVDMSLNWAVNEVAFFRDADCKDHIKGALGVVSSGDLMNSTKRSNAFDGVLDTEWVSNCTTCPAGSAFIGQRLRTAITVRCLKVFQYSEIGSVATRLALQRDGAQVAVYEAEGGSWERWPMPGAGFLWRISNGEMTERNWVLSEVELFVDVNCSIELPVNFTVDASKNWSGTADHIFDDRSDSSWMSVCTRCPVGKAFVEMEFRSPVPDGLIKCVKVLQQGSLETVQLQRWDGYAWQRQLLLTGLGGGLTQAQQRPLAPDTMWRLRALELEGSHVFDGWEVYELRMCGDDNCSRPLRNYKAITSGESMSQEARKAADETFMTWWAGGNNIHQWIGLWFDDPQQVRCFRLWQSVDRWAKKLVLERWDGETWARINSLTYWPAGAGYFSSCAWGVEGTFWRLTHLQPLNGIWRVHEVEFFTDEGCSQRIPDNEFVFAASGLLQSNYQNHLELARDRRRDTFTALCDRHTICQPRSEYIGVDFLTPRVIRCVRVWQSGGGGDFAIERRKGPGGLAASPPTGHNAADERASDTSGGSLVVATYETVIRMLSAPNERWLWANATQQGMAADCRSEPYINNVGWCEKCGCVSCSAGSAPVIGVIGSHTDFCNRCSLGRFSRAEGSYTCEVCQHGKFSNSTGQTECEACPPGFFADTTGRSACNSCPPGFAQPLAGQDRCEICRPGTIASVSGQTACTACSWSLWSEQGASTCRFDGAVISFSLLLFVSVWLASVLFSTALWYTMPIEDTECEDGQVFAKLTGHHWLLTPQAWCRKHALNVQRKFTTTFSQGIEDEVQVEPSIPSGGGGVSAASVSARQASRLAMCSLCGTGIPWVQDMRFRVIVKTRRRVQLLDMSGGRITRPLEASIGCLKLSFREALRQTGFIVPLWVILALIITVAAVCPIAGHLPFYIWLPEVCGCILIGMASHSYRMTRVLKTSHQQRLRRYGSILRRRNPNPQPCPRGPGRAVTVGQLWSLYEYFHGIIGDRDMYYVCSNILKPLTKKSQLSYAELAGPSELTWYVSHYWGTSFRSFVESVRKHAESVSDGLPWRRGCYWICSLGNNQWKVAEELGENWNESSFFLALRCSSCRGTAMVIDEDALPLTRSWCLFEVLQTFLLERDIEMFKGLVLCTESGILNQGATSVDCVLAVTKRLSSLRLEMAQASMESDKKMIDDLVVSELGGFSVMNRFLKRHFQSALLAARNQFEKQFEELADELAEGIRSASKPARDSPQSDSNNSGEFVSLAVEAPVDGEQPSPDWSPTGATEDSPASSSRITQL